MGFFSINKFEIPGRGVDKDAPQKKRFFIFWEIFARKFWKLIPLSLLYTLMCVPIVTIGPATAGLTYVLRNFSQEKHAFVASDFFDAYKRNWKQSVIVSLLDLAAIILLSTAIPFYYSGVEQNYLLYVPLAVCGSVAIFAVLMNYFIFLMIVSLELNLKQMIKNALLLSFACIKTNILTSLAVLPFIALGILAFKLLLFPLFILIMAVIGFAFVGLVICFNSYPYILKYVVNPYYEKQNRVKPIDDELSSEQDEPIFKDIGSQENPVVIDKKKHKNKTIQ